MKAMSSVTRMAEIAALIGEPARANMLSALMDGRALTAKELAYVGHVSPQTASAHLGSLTDAGLLAREQQGRHRYFRLASPLVGSMLESILTTAAEVSPPERRTTWRGGEALREARTCYDHLAGRLAVGLTDALVREERVVLTSDGGEVTEEGLRFLHAFGVDPQAGGNARRVFCRPCLDWSERRPHLAGRLGAAIACRCFELGWVTRKPDTRAVDITAAGRAGFARAFDLQLETMPA
jgi:DNA-binding transcriptional ArsR family regulator